MASGLIARRLYQAAAWGFMASLLMAAFVGHLDDWNAPTAPNEWISGRAFVTVLGVLLLVNLCALAATLAADNVEPSHV